MAEEKRDFTLIVIPSDTSKTYTYRLRRGLIYLLGAICLVIFGSYVYMISVHQRVSSKARKVERLEMENEILRAQTQKVADLGGELASLKSIRQRLYEMAGMTEDLKQGLGSEMPAPTGATTVAGENYQRESAVLAADLVKSAWADTMKEDVSTSPVVWPVRGWVTAEFDEWLPGRDRKHTGLDIAAPQGTPILTAASGKVTFADWDKDLGLVVVVDHRNGLSTLYGHCCKVLVNVGDEVIQGQAIAELGNTGQSSAPHLHFEIRENDVAVDPRNYLGP